MMKKEEFSFRVMHRTFYSILTRITLSWPINQISNCFLSLVIGWSRLFQVHHTAAVQIRA